VARFARGELAPAEVDILDLDEERYRRGEWAVRMYRTALTPFEPAYTQAAKVLIAAGTDDDDKRAIAEFLCEEIAASPRLLYILGPGSTLMAIADALDVDKTLLGIDAVVGGQLAASDLDESHLLALLDEYPEARLVLSPIGAQGFLVGRGNLPLSPCVLRRVGADNLVVVATPAKLARTGALRFDSGDTDLDDELAGTGYLSVVTGYRRRRMVKVAR
jgi:predicted polyphosphate/ATP-dependent NAD kinase